MNRTNRRIPGFLVGITTILSMVVSMLPPVAPTLTTLPEAEAAFNPSATITNMTVGSRVNVMTASDRTAKGLNFWPDGTMGVVRSGTQYTYYTANSSNIARTVGTADNPAASVLSSSIQIQNMKHAYNYTAGGPVYRDPVTGTMLMFYHAEIWDGSYVNFWSLIGMAKSTDGGSTWTDLGEIIRPNSQFGAGNHEITGGTFVIVGDYFYVYFRDKIAGSGTEINLAVARARISDVLAAAASGNVTAWNKYRNGSWTEPGLNGISSALEAGNPGTNFMSVSYNRYSGKYLLVLVNTSGGNWNLAIIESTNGISWSSRVTLETESGESYAPSIIGLGNDPMNSGQPFYVYYSYSNLGGFSRFNDAILARRTLTLNGPVEPTPTPTPTPANNPPTVSSITSNPSDVDPTTAGNQQYESSTVTYSATASDPDGNPLSWAWYYAINGGSWITHSTGSGAVLNAVYTYAAGTAGSIYNWLLRVTDGIAITDSNLTVNVIARPSATPMPTPTPTPTPTSGTSLASLAASMAPGTWATLTTNNVAALKDNGTDGTIFGYANDAGWDPNTKKLLYVGNDHIDGNTNEALHFVIYDEATNTWQNMTPPPWSTPGETDHGYDHHAINPPTGSFYRRAHKEGRVFYRYSISGNTWTALPSNNLMDYASCCGGLDYFPELGGLVFGQGGDVGGGRVFLFRDSTNSWSELARNLTVGYISNHGVYNPVHKVMLFGGGDGNARKLYKISSAGTVTALNDAPTDIRLNSTILTVDPVSGDYLVFTLDRQFYRYNILTDSWQLLNGTGVPIWNPSGHPTDEKIYHPFLAR